MEGISNQPIVIDNGTGTLKAGFAGGDRPRVVFSSAVGRPKHVRIMPGGALEGVDLCVGKKLQEHRGAFRWSYPMEHGVVVDWQEMEQVWGHLYSRDNLNVPSEDHPVLLTEAPLNPLVNREKASEVLFESFNVPAIFLAPQAILSLYASGRTTGVVLDSGDGVSHVVPVYEGFALPHAISRTDVAGRDVTDHLQLLLRRSGYKLYTSAEKDIVRQIKEEKCYLSFDPRKEEEAPPQPDTFRLPDGTHILMGSERFRAPEILFQPELIGSEEKGELVLRRVRGRIQGYLCHGDGNIEGHGVHECVIQSIMKADLDLRKAFFGQIVLAGGSTVFPGYGDRLLNETRKLAPRDVKIRISAPPERKYSTWIGGSILASLSTFKSLWITQRDYQEHGNQIVHTRTL